MLSLQNIGQACFAKEDGAVDECSAGVLLKSSWFGLLLWEI